jgi:sulfur carrier protein
VQIVVNGEPRTMEDRATVVDLLSQLKVTAPHVAVEVNMQLVPRAQHAGRTLQAGDQVEVVTLAGGG